MPEIQPSPLNAATFYVTVNQLRDLPTASSAEIAFVGRSNAGKSSALNRLTGRSRLAYVSKQPGRTQHINYFEVTSGRFLVDLPGYGFARAPDAIRQHWSALVSDYLRHREPLKGLMLLMDARHPMKPLDEQLLRWIQPTGRPVHVLLTKADKLSRSAAITTLRQISQLLASRYPWATAQLFSSLSGEGAEEAQARIVNLLTE